MKTPIEIGPIVDMPIEMLIPHPSNPFGLYTGQRLEDLMESIQANGVLVPVIVRPAVTGFYEILSGHNRVEAAKEVGLVSVPVISRDGLSDEEAMLIVVETNLIQRSFSDFSHSERAATIAIHHDSIKNQGRRTDLIKEVELMLNIGSGGSQSTSFPVDTKFDSKERIGKDHGLSSITIWRYLRINKLIPQHKSRLDSGSISIRAAVSLSYLSADEQELVDDVLTAYRYRLSYDEAEALRLEQKPLTRETVRDIVQDNKRKSRPAKELKLESKFLSRYFKPEQDIKEIQAVIAKALDQYFGVG